MVKIVYGLENNPDAKIVRQAVFVEEQGFQNEFDEIDGRAWHVVLYEDGVPAATGRTFPKGDGGVYLIGRVAVQKAYRGRGLGEKVVRELEKKLKELGAGRAELSAQLQAQGFYEKLGYRPFGRVYHDEHCPHIAMGKDLA